MKYIFFLPSVGLGGSTIYIYNLAKYLVDGGDDVLVICRKKDKGHELFQKNNIPTKISNIPLGLNVTGAGSFNSLKTNILKEFKDVLKFFSGLFYSLPILFKFKGYTVVIGDFNIFQISLACIFLKMPYITLIQTSVSKCQLKKMLVTFFLNKSSKIISITNVHKNQFQIKEKVKHVVLHNPVTFPHMIQLNKKIKINKTILFIGGISKIKGTNIFVDLAFLLLEKHDNINFQIIGDYNEHFSCNQSNGRSKGGFTETQSIFDLITQRDKWDAFEIVGVKEDVSTYIHNCDILVSTNRFPHFSRPIIEAWACRKPIVAIDDHINRKIVKDSHDGMLFPSNDLYIGAEKILKLLTDKGIYSFISENGYRKYLKNYSMEAYNQSIKTIFN